MIQFLLILPLICLGQVAPMTTKPGSFIKFKQAGGATCNTTLQSFGTDSSQENLGSSSSLGWLASSNRWTTSTTTCAVKVSLLKSGSPVGNITAYIYSEGSSVPGSVLATSTTTLAASTLTGSEAVYAFTFNFSPVSGTTYWVALNNSVIDAANFVLVRIDGGSSGGALFQSANGTSWGSDFGTRGFFMSAMGSP